MLRINLLPPYIYEGKKRLRVGAVWVVAVLAVAGGFVGWWVMLGQQVDKIKAEQASMEAKATEADQYAAKTTAVQSESQVIVGKATFVRQSREHIQKTYPTVVYNVRDYTLRNVLYSSLAPEGQTVSLTAYAPSLADVGHYMMWMERNKNISNVNIELNGLPSFPVPQGFGGNQGQQASGPRPPNARGYDFGVRLTLMQPIPGAPSYPGGGGGAATGGTGGGSPMMGPGGMPMAPPSAGGNPMGSGGGMPFIGPGSMGSGPGGPR